MVDERRASPDRVSEVNSSLQPYLIEAVGAGDGAGQGSGGRRLSARSEQ